MVVRVAVALVPAAVADGDTGLEQRPHDLWVVLSRPAEHTARGVADVRAVKAEPDALHHVREILLTQVGVGVSYTGLDAFVQRVERIG